MATERWNPGTVAERRQLFFLAVGASVIAAASFGLAGRRVLPAILLGVACVAGCGAVAHRWVGRDVYLFFALVAGAIARVVSAVVVGLTYLLAIGCFGSVARALGVNRLERNFETCRKRETMLVGAPGTDVESFRRQS